MKGNYKNVKGTSAGTSGYSFWTFLCKLLFLENKKTLVCHFQIWKVKKLNCKMEIFEKTTLITQIKFLEK